VGEFNLPFFCFSGGGFTPIPFGLLAGISVLGLHSDAKWMKVFFSNNIWQWIGRLWIIFFLISVIWYFQLENICSILNSSTTELGAFGLLICLIAVLTGIIYDTNKKVIPS
jgi:hypothetical protein